jgi:Ca2+-transporting ATPase
MIRSPINSPIGQKFPLAKNHHTKSSKSPMIHSTYGLTPREIDEIIDARVVGKRLADKLEQHGGLQGLAQKLHTDLENGIDIQKGNEESDPSYLARQHTFGTNVLPKPPSPWWIQRFFAALSDTMLIVLMVVSVISIILGVAFPKTPDERPFGWIEGFAIFAAVFIVSSVTATNDHNKDKQFRALNEQEKNKDVKIYRKGVIMELKSNDIVTGDIIKLSTGAAIPADGLFIQGDDFKVDESTMTGEPIAQQKNQTDKSYLLSGCTVVEGNGTMLVLAVGAHSQWGKTMAILHEELEDTPLQQKLDSLAMSIGRVGIGFATATFCISVIGWLITTLVASSGGTSAFSTADINTIVNFLIVSITIIVVAVPEGLPLAVTISLAYSVDKMMQENQLVRHLQACEVMGGATTICSDKTGTLTQNKMTVISAYFGGTFYKQGSLPKYDELNTNMTTHIIRGISINSTADLGEKEIILKQYPSLIDKMCCKKLREKKTIEPTVIGNPTEGAMLKLVNQSWGQHFEAVRKDPTIPVVHRISFSSKRKRMSTIVQFNGEYVLYNKGAAEIIVKLCTKIMDGNGNIVEFTGDKRSEILSQVEEIAKLGQRTICLAFKFLGSEKKNWDESEESDLVFSALVGIEDPLRPEVYEAVKRCQKSGVKIRMVTGDNLDTAKKIAHECGIYTDGVCMEGPDFREMYEKDPKGLLKLLPNLQVLARSSPDDKYILVSELKRCGEIVAVTGDGTNDAPALKKAHVGLAMGSGTQVAKEAADIIVLDDNFKTIVTACKWGRSIYENIRKFLQFQLTVNVVALILLVIASITQFVVPADPNGSSGLDLPLTAIQLLWLNLIMDTFAALALSTEEPDDALWIVNHMGNMKV